MHFCIDGLLIGFCLDLSGNAELQLGWQESEWLVLGAEGDLP